MRRREAEVTTTTIVEKGINTTVRDGSVLYADLYRPAGGSRLPVLLERTPYGRGIYLGAGMPLDPLRAAAAGFAVVIQDVRGRGDSDGEFYPFTNESTDGYDAVEWCASQPWSNGQVGMYGSSYMGATAWQAACATPPSLLTMTPSQASSDYFEGRSYRGGVLELGSLLSTALLALAPGAAERTGGARMREDLREARSLLDNLNDTASTAPLAALKSTVLGRLTPYFFDWLEHATYDAYWESLSLEPHYDRVPIPTLHLTSWFDPFLVGTLRNFEGMVMAGQPHQHLIVGPWTHHVPMAALLGSARVGDMDCGLGSMLDFDRVQLSWFRAVFSQGRPPPDQPRVMYFLMGENRWKTTSVWPPPTRELQLHLASNSGANGLRGDGRLEALDSASAESDTFVYDPNTPIPTLGGAHGIVPTSYPAGSFDQRSIESRDDVLVYTSRTLEQDLDVVGWVSVTVSVASTAVDTDFTAKLVDVQKSGRAVNICDGARRLGLRASLSTPMEYAAGEVCQMTILMDATGYRFRRGHAVRIEISSSNFPRLSVNPNSGQSAYTDPQRKPAVQTIFHSPHRPSFLTLPVLERLLG
jgi:putative CocE/NonD family hydrolase